MQASAAGGRPGLVLARGWPEHGPAARRGGRRKRSELQPGHMPLTAGKVELSGRALLPSGAGGVRVAVFDDEPTSVIAYFLATK